jgi:hypothetical protein
MVHIYNEITIYIYKAIFPSGARLPPDPVEGVNPLCTPHVEECTFFWGVKFSWGINMVENKDL